MATSELAMKLAAMRARMDEGTATKDETPTAAMEAKKNKQETVDNSQLPQNNGDTVDTSHSTAFGGGKPSAILKAKKMESQIRSDSPNCETPEPNKSGGSLTATSTCTEESAVTDTDPSSTVGSQKEIESESTPQCLDVKSVEVDNSNVNTEKSDDKPLQAEKVKDEPKVRNASPTGKSNRVESSVDIDEKYFMNKSNDTSLTYSFEADIRPLIASSSSAFSDVKQVKRAQYESFDDDPSISYIHDDQTIQSTPSIQAKSPTVEVDDSGEYFDQVSTQNSSYMNNNIISEQAKLIQHLEEENKQLQDQLHLAKTALAEKEDLVNYLMHNINQLEKVMSLNNQPKMPVPAQHGNNDRRTTLKPALKNNSGKTKNSRRFVC